MESEKEKKSIYFRVTQKQILILIIFALSFLYFWSQI